MAIRWRIRNPRLSLANPLLRVLCILLAGGFNPRRLSWAIGDPNPVPARQVLVRNALPSTQPTFYFRDALSFSIIVSIYFFRNSIN